VKQEDPLDRWTKLGNIVLIGGGVLCILVLSYSYYSHELTRQRVFSSPIALFSYYYLPAALATLLFWALSLGQSQKINLSILFISLGISGYGAEVFLTILDLHAVTEPLWGSEFRERQYETKKLARQFGVDFDTRSRLEVINDVRTQGIEAVPYVVPSRLLNKQADGTSKSELSNDGTELLPLGGISDRVTVFCNETGEYSIYHSDEHGFHNPKGIWRSDRVPIVALGDSFAQGGCVASDKNFVALIRNRYPGTLNLGMAGDGPLTMLATLKEYEPTAKAKTVLWFYFEDDLSDLEKEEQSPLLMKYLRGEFTQDLINRQIDIDQALLGYVKREMAKKEGATQEPSNTIQIGTTLIQVSKLGTLRGKMGLLTATATDDRSAETMSKRKQFQEILLQAKQTVSAQGGRLYFVYLPAWERYGNPRLASQTGSKYREQVLELVKTIDIPIVDIHLAFQAQQDPLSLFSFRRSGHYNEEGQRIVAEKVLGSISATN
jgi:hypothetical protein